MKSYNYEVPFLNLKAQHAPLQKEFEEIFAKVLRSQAFILGSFVEKFEKDFGNYLGVEEVIGVNSGTDALLIALRALGIGEGDEVITAPNSFFATAEAILHAKAKPVFVDVEAKTALIDAKKIEEKISKRTKAILPVHLYGQPCDMDEILGLARKHKLFVVEDACQAAGSSYKNKKAGTLGDIGCFSFYPGKNLGALGDGGALATHSPEIAQKARMLRDHGQAQKYQHDLVGYNSRLDGLQAAFLSIKLVHLDSWNAQRKKWDQCYRKHLSNIPWLETFEIKENRQTNHHLFVVKIAPASDRNPFRENLKGKGIETGIHYPKALHKLLAKQDPSYRETCPVAESLADSIISLPMYAELTEEMIEKVMKAIQKWKR